MEREGYKRTETSLNIKGEDREERKAYSSTKIDIPLAISTSTAMTSSNDIIVTELFPDEHFISQECFKEEHHPHAGLNFPLRAPYD
jgi:hypothetical protein